jgi:hypothetical protein
MSVFTQCLETSVDAVMQPAQEFSDSDVSKRHVIVVLPAMVYTCLFVVLLSVGTLWGVMTLFYGIGNEVSDLASDLST